MSSNSNISSDWTGFRKLWIAVALLLLALLVALMLLGYSPWSPKAEIPPTIVEKEKLVDNPELLTRIDVLEKENAQIAGLNSNLEELKKENSQIVEFKANIEKLKNENTQILGLKASVANLSNSKGLVAGLQAKVKALEAIDLNFDNPVLMRRINLLKIENASIADMKKRIMELEAANGVNVDERSVALAKKVSVLETENALIEGLKAKVSALEAIDINFIKQQDNTKLLQTINNLEVRTLAIPSLESRIQSLQAEKPVLTKRISELESQNAMIPGLEAKIGALEAIDINFIKAEDNTKLLQKINNLEVQTLAIPTLKSRIQTLQTEKPVLTKRIGDLEAQNGMIPGLKAKIGALEAIDINFMKAEDNTKLLQKINNLEVQTLAIPTLKSRIQTLQTEQPILTKRIGDLEAQNGMIPGLKAKIEALEGIDINFIKSDSSNSGSSMMTLPKTAKLFFQPGSSRFPVDLNQSMAEVIVYLRTNSSSSVSLAGFHDNVGNANWNRRLSTKRSNTVRQTLIDAGISSDRITVDTPTQTLGTGLPEEARRVEVSVYN